MHTCSRPPIRFPLSLWLCLCRATYPPVSALMRILWDAWGLGLWLSTHTVVDHHFGLTEIVSWSACWPGSWNELQPYFIMSSSRFETCYSPHCCVSSEPQDVCKFLRSVGGGNAKHPLHTPPSTHTHTHLRPRTQGLSTSLCWSP